MKQARKVIGRVLATLAILGLFYVLLTGVPYLPGQSPDTSSSPAAPGSLVTSGAASQLEAIEAGSVLGLFQGSFAADAAGSGFSSSEQVVDGPCRGAGARYVDAVCPGCPVVPGGDATPGEPGMLLWVEGGTQHAVSADCVSINDQQQSIVGVLTFFDETMQLGGETAGSVNSKIPIVPGARRTAAIEMGSWTVAFDEVADTGLALSRMAGLLVAQGWREVSPDVPDLLPSVVGERVFANGTAAYCVVSVSQDGAQGQLVTMINMGI